MQLFSGLLSLGLCMQLFSTFEFLFVMWKTETSLDTRNIVGLI